MARQTYPTTPKPSYSYTKTESYRTLISEFDSGVIRKTRQMRFPLRQFDLTYNILSKTNRNTLHDFYRARHGSYESFWYFDFSTSKNWDDEFVGYGGPLEIDGYLYSTGGISYTDQTEEAQSTSSTDMTLLTTDVSTDNANYWGGEIPFDRITLTVGQAATGDYTIAWQYYSNTGGFTALTNASDNSSGFRQSGNINWDMPSNWIEAEISGRSLYWARSIVTAVTTDTTTAGVGSQATINTKTYDLHCLNNTSGNVTISNNSTVTTGWSFVSSGGGGGADRITLSDYATQGALITSDLAASHLRIKGYMGDEFPETMNHPAYTDVRIKISEEHW